MMYHQKKLYRAHPNALTTTLELHESPQGTEEPRALRGNVFIVDGDETDALEQATLLSNPCKHSITARL